MSSSSIVRRALLYVPSSSQKMLTKSRGLTVDNITYDLEDSVTPSKKAEARTSLLSFLNQPRAPGIKEQAIRINAVDSGLALEDLTTLLPSPNLDAIVVPKVNSPADLHFVTDVIRHVLPERHPSSPSPSTQDSTQDPTQAPHPPPLKILALIESAKALTDLNSICKSTPYLSGLIFAAEDFALDLSLRRTPSLHEFLYARSSIVTAARAHSLPSAIDLVCTSFRGESGLATLEQEALDGRGLGFNGKQCVHPDQVETVQRAFAPGGEEVGWAVRVMLGDERAREEGRGAWELEGRMVDAPVVGLARGVLGRAEACGVDVGRVRGEWEGREVE